MSDTKVFRIDEGNNGGLFGGNGGWGGGILGFLLGLMFGNGGWGGFGGFGGNGGNGAAGFLANQINNDNGRDLLMQAVTSSGQRSTDAIAALANTIGQDFNLVNSGVQSIIAALGTISANQGMNALQVINAIQSGDAALGSQFAQCCCQNQLAMANLNAGIQKGFGDVQASIAAKGAADQLSTCQQTYALTDTMNRNYQLLDNKIDAMESNRKDREITALTAKVAELESQKYTAAVAQQSVAPVLGQLNALAQEVAAIKRCQPPVKTVVDNSQTIVPTIWANGVADLIVDRIAAALGTTTTPTT